MGNSIGTIHTNDLNLKHRKTNSQYEKKTILRYTEGLSI